MVNFIDLEASGLGVGSYPIEVGVALGDGSTHCTLVCPPQEWQHWDASAENLHGISRETLLLNGRSPLKVAMLLNEWLADTVVYSDAWGNDGSWLARLFDEAGVRQRFRVDSIVSLLSPAQLDLWTWAKEQAERSLFLRRHRASNDALILQVTYEMLQNEELPYEDLMKRLVRQQQSAQRSREASTADVVDLPSVRALHADVQARQLQGENSLEKQLGRAENEQLLNIIEKQQLQF